MQSAYICNNQNKASLGKSLLVCLALLAAFALSLCVGTQSAWAQGGTWSGSGSENDPYLIEDSADLISLSKCVYNTETSTGESYAGKYFALTNDIDLNNQEFQPIGYSANYPFSGTFDGKGYRISGLSIKNNSSMTGTGFFGYVSASSSSPAAIKNFVLQGEISNTNSIGFCGGICGQANKFVSFQNLGNEVNITASKGSNIGGILGSTNTGAISATKEFAGTLGNAFIAGETTPILTWQTAGDDPVALQVVVKGFDGAEQSRVDIKKSELEALASDSEEAARGQYFKGGKWTVLSSDNYVPISAILEATNTTVTETDAIGFESGGEAYSKWSDTLSHAQSGKWYPNAVGADDLGEAAQDAMPFALALTYSKGSGATVADAQAALAPADGNTALMGVYTDSTNAVQQGGNRFCSNVSAIVVQRADPVVLHVIEKDDSGNEINRFQMTQSQLEGLASDSQEPARSQYFKNGNWTVLSSDSYVDIASIFEANGISPSDKDTVSFESGGAPYTKWSGTLSEATSGKWYPNATATDNLGEAAQGTLPFALALNYSKGSGTSINDAETALAPAKGNVVMMGIYQAQDGSIQQGGNRLCSNADGVVLTRAKANLTGTWLVGASNRWWYSYDAATQAAQGKAWPADQWALIDNVWYHFDSAGYMQTGWIRSNVNFAGKATPGNDGQGAWYKLAESGALLKDRWERDSKGWCLLDAESGEMLFDVWTRDSVAPCYIGHDGYCLTGWFKVATDVNGNKTLGSDNTGAWYFADNSGRVQRGNWYKDSRGWCYTDPDTGMMWTNRWVADSSGWCFVTESGYCATGSLEITTSDGQPENPGPGTYEFDSNGRLISQTTE